MSSISDVTDKDLADRHEFFLSRSGHNSKVSKVILGKFEVRFGEDATDCNNMNNCEKKKGEGRRKETTDLFPVVCERM